jgi:transcriptional regulator with XRE-family HTH domain
MNAILGARIRSLRESKGFTQEQVAEKMNCTRQKYARLEKGLLDISYASITTIAQILRIKTEEITSSVNNIDQKQPMFREYGTPIQEDKFEFINEMLDIFYAHRKLYKSVRQVDADE